MSIDREQDISLGIYSYATETGKRPMFKVYNEGTGSMVQIRIGSQGMYMTVEDALKFATGLITAIAKATGTAAA